MQIKASVIAQRVPNHVIIRAAAPERSAVSARCDVVGEGVVAGANVVIRAPTPVQGHVWVTRGGGRAVSAPPGRASGSMGPLPDPSESLSGHVRSTA